MLKGETANNSFQEAANDIRVYYWQASVDEKHFYIKMIEFYFTSTYFWKLFSNIVDMTD